MPNERTSIYHLTHIENIQGIVEAGGLWCDSERLKRSLIVRNIAYSSIKERRRTTSVPLAAGGVLADYVPFYFANRSPMLAAIHKGVVPDCTAAQEELVYLVASVETVAAQKCQWCFTDGHAIERITHYFDNLDELSQLDWQVIKSRSWGATPDDPDRKRKKQAEFLVHGFFSLAWITHFAVKSPEMWRRLANLLTEMGVPQRIWRQPGWYYQDHD